MLWKLLYNLVAMPLMLVGLLAAGLFSPKVRRGIKGRLGEGERLRLAASRCRSASKRVLIHCASAGELEGAIPLMDELAELEDVDILLSYYSPSAVERAMKLTQPRDHFYLPVDSRKRVKRLYDVLAPDLVVFMKHDIWPNMVWEGKRRGVPVALVNGNFRPDSKRLKRAAIPFGRSVLPHLAAIYAVARDDAKRFQFLAGDGPVVEVAGDTRFDRVRQRALQGHEDQGALSKRLRDASVIVAGSTWPGDEKLLLPAFADLKQEKADALLMLVPHEPTADRIRHLLKSCEERGWVVATLSEAEAGVPITDVLLVDRVGVLAGLYGLGSIAYVGGGFGDGVHSVIEPAVFGLPVLFGPRHLMSHEARDLLKLGGARCVENEDQLTIAMRDALFQGEASRQMGEAAADYVQQRAGVARRIAAHLALLAEL